jgi:hypothetical protein
MAQATPPTIYQSPPITVISQPIYNYQSSGGSAIWRLRGLNGNSVGSEFFQSVRETKWFNLVDCNTSVKIRRVTMNYVCQKPISVYVYKDFEENHFTKLTFPKLTKRGLKSIKATARAKSIKLRIESATWVTGGLEIYGMEIDIDAGQNE